MVGDPPPRYLPGSWESGDYEPMQTLVLSKDRGNRALLTALGSAVTLAVIFTIFDSGIHFGGIPTALATVAGDIATAAMHGLAKLPAAGNLVARTGGWPLAFSGAAFLVSLLTLYLTCLRAPRLQPFLGDLLLVHYTPDGHLHLCPEIAIFNSGARAGALIKISGTICLVGGDAQSQLHWISFEELTYAARPGERNLPYSTFAGHPQSLVLAKSEAVSKRIGMISERKFRLLPGTHRLEITLHTGPRGNNRVRLKRRLEISREEERWAYENRGEETTNTVQNLGLYHNPGQRCFTRSGAPPD